MKINISREMARAAVGALIRDVNHGIKTYGTQGDYQVTNQEALEFFEEVLDEELATGIQLGEWQS